MIRIAIIGMGQIARTQHLPAILGNPDFVLGAIVNPEPVPVPDGVPLVPSMEALLASGVSVDAVAVCTPPGAHFDIARQAIQVGLHVLLEKPPTSTAAGAEILADMASDRGCTLFTAWHSMFAAGVQPARALVAARAVRAVDIVWRENSEKWHPGVDWFWRPGDFGAFDAGINAISLALAVLDRPLFLMSAELDIQEGRHTPVRASAHFILPDTGADVRGLFDIGYDADNETWQMTISLGDGERVVLSCGGGALMHDGRMVALPLEGKSPLEYEYAHIYRRFAALISTRQSEVETRPSRLVADILGFGARRTLPMEHSNG